MKMLRATFFAFLMFAIIGGYFYVMHNLEGWYMAATTALRGEK